MMSYIASVLLVVTPDSMRVERLVSLYNDVKTIRRSGLSEETVNHRLAVELGPVVAKLVNLSFARQKVARAWRTATITPVPKTSIVIGPGDLRPISVMSILSRTIERLVVKNYLTPLLKSSSFRDQYAYKPTGSTVCAFVDFTYRIHTLLESNRYVRCVLIDSTKAFDRSTM